MSQSGVKPFTSSFFLCCLSGHGHGLLANKFLGQTTSNFIALDRAPKHTSSTSCTLHVPATQSTRDIAISPPGICTNLAHKRKFTSGFTHNDGSNNEAPSVVGQKTISLADYISRQRAPAQLHPNKEIGTKKGLRFFPTRPYQSYTLPKEEALGHARWSKAPIYPTPVYDDHDITQEVVSV